MDKKLDDALRNALMPRDEADLRLNRKILNHAKEQRAMTQREITQRTMTAKRTGKLTAVASAAAVVLCVSSITVYAAWRYLSSSEVAGSAGDISLAEAFAGEQALLINETQSCGDYKVTLLGIVSGEALSAYPHEHNGSIAGDRTYAVIAVENGNGMAMPDGSQEAYGKTELSRNLSSGDTGKERSACEPICAGKPELFASPLIGGYNPALYNLAGMAGNYTDITEDGVLYRLIECDNVEIFADHDLYLCVTEGTFYNREAYRYDEATGEISRNEEYEGLNALFALPVDASKADPGKAAEYIAALGFESDYAKDKLSAELDDSFEVEAGEGNPWGAEAAEYALQFVGNPYAWGEESLTQGTDSSGFTKSVYAHFGVSLPHDTTGQREIGTEVEMVESAQPGDLIFYETPAHAAIYLGEGMVVHAMPEMGVCISEADFDEIAEIRRIVDGCED